ncbi:MAG: hypothetical protein ACJAWY_000351 [Sphingomonas echinoides]|jgi:hypothetical protein
MSVLSPHRPADLPRQPDRLLAGAPAPIVLAYGIGVDSTALLCGESISAYDVDGCGRRPATVENH